LAKSRAAEDRSRRIRHTR